MSRRYPAAKEWVWEEEEEHEEEEEGQGEDEDENDDDGAGAGEGEADKDGQNTGASELISKEKENSMQVLGGVAEDDITQLNRDDEEEPSEYNTIWFLLWSELSCGSRGLDSSYFTLGGIQSPPYLFFRDGYLTTNVSEVVGTKHFVYSSLKLVSKTAFLTMKKRTEEIVKDEVRRYYLRRNGGSANEMVRASGEKNKVLSNVKSHSLTHS